MNTESQGKLEVSSDVVEQLNSMVRDSAAPGAYRVGPAGTPGPNPTRPPKSIDSFAHSSYEE